jgi:hypothetical protein
MRFLLAGRVTAAFISDMDASAKNVAKLKTRRSAASADFLIYPGDCNQLQGG